MALVLCCGGECQIVTKGLGTAANLHWGEVGGTPAVESSIVRSGSKAISLPDATAWVGRACAATRTVGYVRLYFYYADATPASQATLVFATTSPGADGKVYVTTGGVLGVGWGSVLQTGLTLADATWYGVEAEFDVTANPNVIRWRDWSAATGWTNRTDATVAQAAAVLQYLTVEGGGAVIFDDLLIGEGVTPGEDYGATSALSGGKVLRYLPNADLAHAFTTNDFEYDDTTGINSAATDVWTYLDDAAQSSIADGFISQNVAGAGKLIQVAFADEASETAPRAVGVTSTHHSAGTGANEMHLRVSDDGATWTNVWGDWSAAGHDTSDTTAHFRHKVLTTKPSGGAWTTAAVNAMRAQWGNSDDVSAIPYLDSVSLEVEWTETRVPYASPYPQLLPQ